MLLCIMSDCIFCKIISKEIPNYTVYEDDHVLAFLDIHPHAKGHTVIIPKDHVDNFSVLSEGEYVYILQAVKEVMNKLDQALQPTGYNVGWNEKPAGGQVVPHLHVHVMPRYDGDGGKSMHAIVNNAGDIAVEEIHKLIS